MPDIPNFNPDPELEELLTEDPTALDNETLLDVQLYKSKKLQAKRDAGESDEEPNWPMIRPGDFANGNVSENGTAKTTDTSEDSDSESPEESSEDGEPQQESDQPSDNKSDTSLDETDGRVDYYKTLKDDYEVASQGASRNEDETSTDGDSSNKDETIISEDGNEVSNDSKASFDDEAGLPDEIADSFADHLRELEQKLFLYHEKNLELKDTIAELREQNARLEERVHQLQS